MEWRNRAHFFAIASRMIRRIRVDHARGSKAAKQSRRDSASNARSTGNVGKLITPSHAQIISHFAPDRDGAGVDVAPMLMMAEMYSILQ